MDVEYFPFDEQTCVMKFGSWTYDGFQVAVMMMMKMTVMMMGIWRKDLCHDSKHWHETKPNIENGKYWKYHFRNDFWLGVDRSIFVMHGGVTISNQRLTSTNFFGELSNFLKKEMRLKMHFSAFLLCYWENFLTENLILKKCLFLKKLFKFIFCRDSFWSWSNPASDQYFWISVIYVSDAIALNRRLSIFHR